MNALSLSIIGTNSATYPLTNVLQKIVVLDVYNSER